MTMFNKSGKKIQRFNILLHALIGCKILVKMSTDLYCEGYIEINTHDNLIVLFFISCLLSGEKKPSKIIF